MQGQTLTPHRRTVLYDRILGEADVDSVHLVVHALAGTPDGALDVRSDYAGLEVKEWTSAEVLDDYIEVTGVPERGPDSPVRVDLVVEATPLPGQPFDEEDLIDAVIATCHELFPHDGGDPVVPTIHTP